MRLLLLLLCSCLMSFKGLSQRAQSSPESKIVVDIPAVPYTCKFTAIAKFEDNGVLHVQASERINAILTLKRDTGSIVARKKVASFIDYYWDLPKLPAGMYTVEVSSGQYCTTLVFHVLDIA